MDPLSITATVLRITGSCVGAAHTLWEIRNAWKRAPMTVDILCSQLKLTAASLSQIQSLLLGNTDVLRNKPALVHTFDTTLTSCLVLSTSLDQYILKITKGVLETSDMTWKAKFKTLWNETEVKELLGHLHTQQGGISVLVSLLQMDSIYDIRRLVRQQNRLLRKIVANTRNLRAQGVKAPESVLETDEPNDSIFSQLIRSEGDEDHGFEAVILNSKVYSTAFTNTLPPATDDGQSDDARTVVEPTHSPTMLAPQIRSAIKNLHIAEIWAICQVPYIARSDEELNFEAGDIVTKLQKERDTRYRGEIYTGSRPGQGRSGCFDRRHVVICFMLDLPLKVQTTAACSFQLRDISFTYEAGDTLHIEVIAHSPFWGVRQRNGGEITSGAKESVHVCDLTFDAAWEQDINRVLQYFACPIPALTSLSKNELHKRMRDIIRKGSTSEGDALLAHCSSLAESQLVALEEKRRSIRLLDEE